MKDIHQNITEWLQKRPDWQQDTAHRLLTKGALSEDDIEEIVTLMKSSPEENLGPQRSFENLRQGADSQATLRLMSIGDIRGIDRLEPSQPLTFGNGNLTVIYGHNGSGKSGYTRILKNVCGHPRADTLRPNVFEQKPSERQCDITFALGNQKTTHTWKTNSGAIDTLRAVDLFDSETAGDYLSRQTSLTYSPPQIAFFSDLVSACYEIRKKLKAEQDSLPSQLPDLPPKLTKTASGSIYQSLHSVDSESVKSLKSWTTDDQTSLNDLGKRLNTTDPAQQATNKRKITTQIDQLIVKIETAQKALTPEKIQEIRTAKQTASNKRRIAIQANNVQSAKLEGVGSETWRALWMAAKRFSLESAYPEKDFPATGNNARCVLCHQELDSDAQTRMAEFDAFIQGTVEQAAQEAESAYSALIDSLPEALDDQSIETTCTAIDLISDPWPTQLREFWNQVKESTQCLKDGEPKQKAPPLESPQPLINELIKMSEKLASEAEQHEKDGKQFDRGATEKEKLNLEARHWTSQQATAIEKEITRLTTVKRYSAWIDETQTQAISRKSGEISEQVITTAYIKRFNDELKRLDASHIKVELTKTGTPGGVPVHQLKLKGAKIPDAKVEAILSEGERRIISLSAFLADVGDKPHAAPFIFDDPISSLDGEFEWSVALRLAQLAKERQVIIFTHRLSLFGAAEDAAKKIGEGWKKTNLEQRFIESFNGVSGQPSAENVANAKTEKANNLLLTDLDRANKEGQKQGTQAYQLHAQVICTEFRKLLERTVEDDLLNQVVRRHRRSVQTDNRLGKLPAITTADCQLIDRLMTKYSKFEHSQSTDTQVRIPQEKELRTDLETLRDWRKDYKKRPMEAMA